jgi:hypothetical protein
MVTNFFLKINKNNKKIIKIIKKFNSFVAIIEIISDTNHKNNILQGYGRNGFDAIRTVILNLVDLLLQDEKYVNNIRESLKVFMKIVLNILFYFNYNIFKYNYN